MKKRFLAIWHRKLFNMKKSIYIFGIILIVALAVFILVSDANKPDPVIDPQQERVPVLSTVEKTSVTVYYLSENGQYLLPLSYTIAATTEAATVAVEKLLAGPPVAEVKDCFISDVKLQNLYMIGQTTYLDVTGELIAKAEQENPLAIDAIIATILSLSSTDQLRILIDGKESATEFGGRPINQAFTMPYLNLYGDSITIANSSDFVAGDYQAIVCYIPTESGQYVLPFTSLVKLEEIEDMEEDELTAQATLAVNAMLSLPPMEGVFAWSEPVPLLNNLYIEDGIAYCDFNEAILEPFGRREEGLFQRCLLRTVGSLEGISAVQIMVNGEIVLATASGLDMAHPLTIERAVNSQWETVGAVTVLPE